MRWLGVVKKPHIIRGGRRLLDRGQLGAQGCGGGFKLGNAQRGGGMLAGMVRGIGGGAFVDPVHGAGAIAPEEKARGARCLPAAGEPVSDAAF